jgi:uncharacterized RDD family membrane protein YckC
MDIMQPFDVRGDSQDHHTIDTPEQMQLRLEVAGIGTRFIAIAVDSMIQILVALVALVVLFFLGISGALVGASRNWLLAAYGFGAFLLFYGYYAIFEILWNGQTPGKRYAGIRVIKETGRPLSSGEHVGRNLMRIIDQMPVFYAVGISVALFNSQHKRLGDLLVGAILVREKDLAELKPLSYGSREVSTDALLSAAELTADDLELMETFLARRDSLEGPVRRATAAKIVARVRPKLPPDANVVGTDEAVLEALAYQIRGSGRLRN